MTPVPAMFDWDLRVKNMSNARVDVAVVSLTWHTIGDMAGCLARVDRLAGGDVREKVRGRNAECIFRL